MRIAHISDLHFGSFTLSPFQFFSKRWLGNFNFLLTRKRLFSYARLLELLELFREEKVTHVIISGDLTVTSRSKEYKMGKRFVDLLKKEGLFVFTIPGNHDHYTRKSYKKKAFYRYFDKHFGTECPFNLQEDQVTYTPLKKGLWLMGLDTATATSLVSSQGHFTPKVEENLEKALQNIPQGDKVILVNHYPFFNAEGGRKKELVRGEILKKKLLNSPVFLYLHGHTHRQTVANLTPSDLPIISDSGSTPHTKHGACHLLTLEENKVLLDVYRYGQSWEKQESHTFDV